jgi:hypothetical protein
VRLAAGRLAVTVDSVSATGETAIAPASAAGGASEAEHG